MLDNSEAPQNQQLNNDTESNRAFGTDSSAGLHWWHQLLHLLAAECPSDQDLSSRTIELSVS